MMKQNIITHRRERIGNSNNWKTKVSTHVEFETLEEATEAYVKLAGWYMKLAVLFAKSYFANKVLLVALIISILYNIFGG